MILSFDLSDSRVATFYPALPHYTHRGASPLHPHQVHLSSECSLTCSSSTPGFPSLPVIQPPSTLPHQPFPNLVLPVP